MKRMGIDLDGVIYRWQDTYLFLANHYLGVNLPPVEEFWFEWNAPLKYLTEDQNDWLWTVGIRHGLFRYGSLYKGSAEALRVLDNMADLIVLTSRPRSAIQDTLDWLAYQKFPLTEVHILSDRPKSTVLCDIYLDDAEHNVLDLAKNTNGLVMLWRRPWNQKFPNNYEGIRVVNSWEEVIEVVKNV